MGFIMPDPKRLVRFNVYYKSRMIRHSESLNEVAELVKVHPHEITWAIAEYGKCDVQDYTVVPEGPPL